MNILTVNIKSIPSKMEFYLYIILLLAKHKLLYII